MADKLMKPNKNPLPALPTMFGNLAPIELPELDMSKGLVSNYFQKRKIRQAAEAYKSRAEIAEYQEREVTANAGRLMTALMFGRDYELRIVENEAKKDMFKLEGYHKQEIIRSQVLKNEEQSIKNNILKIELKDVNLNFKQKLKDLGVSDDYEDEDR